MAWPPPFSARWTALALFLFAFALHLFVVVFGGVAQIDFKTLIILDEVLAILAAPLVFALMLRLNLAEAFLLRSTHWGHYVVAGATAIPLQLMSGAMQEYVLESIPRGDQWRELLERSLEPLLRSDGPADIVLLITGGVLLAAVCEEILFRGLMLRLLTRHGRWPMAMLVTGVLFAAFHLDPIGLLPRTLMGVYFALLVWRSGSIFPAMLAHGANNLLAFAAIPLIGDTPTTPDPQQTLIVALVSGAVFVALLIAYLRFTAPAPEFVAAEPVAPPAAPDPDGAEAGVDGGRIGTVDLVKPQSEETAEPPPPTTGGAGPADR